MSDPVKKPPKRKMHPDTILILAQIGLTVLLLSAIIGIVAAFFILKTTMQAEARSTLTNIVIALTTLLTLSWQYFFSRQRPNGLPDPNPPGDNHAPLSTGGKITVTGNDPTRSVAAGGGVQNSTGGH